MAHRKAETSVTAEAVRLVMEANYSTPQAAQIMWVGLTARDPAEVAKPALSMRSSTMTRSARSCSSSAPRSSTRELIV